MNWKKSKLIQTFKSILKKLGLYSSVVQVYCWIENIYVKGQDLLQYIYSLFLNAHFKKEVDFRLPLPPVRMVYLVTNTYKYEWFYNSGIVGSKCICEILEKNNFNINKFQSILDFGCGCGRIIRHWEHLNGPAIYGVDYNPDLVRWCRENLIFADFAVNSIAANLIYENEKFDFIYAISVFTHFTVDLGIFWMKELHRILKPGGVMYLTFMGTTRVPYLRQEFREQYEAGQIIVTGEEHAGKNICAAFHPEQYVRAKLTKGLRVLEFVPGGAKDANQDVYLLQKISTS